MVEVCSLNWSKTLKIYFPDVVSLQLRMKDMIHYIVELQVESKQAWAHFSWFSSKPFKYFSLLRRYQTFASRRGPLLDNICVICVQIYFLIPMYNFFTAYYILFPFFFLSICLSDKPWWLLTAPAIEVGTSSKQKQVA